MRELRPPPCHHFRPARSTMPVLPRVFRFPADGRPAWRRALAGASPTRGTRWPAVRKNR